MELNTVLPHPEDDKETYVNRTWRTTAEGRKYLAQIEDSKDSMGIMDEISLPGVSDVREIKIVVYGKAAVGKTSSVANLSGQEIPSSYVETAGVHVVSSLWPVQLLNGKLVLFKYKLWDCGATGIKKYTYLAQAYNVEPKAVIFVFSITDRESFEDLVKQLEMKSGTSSYQKIPKLVICTKNDNFLQSQVTRAEIAELSHKCHVPVYMIKNLHSPSPMDQAQNEKDMIKIKNDLADLVLAQDYHLRVKLFKKESRFKITTKRKNINASPANTLKAVKSPSMPDIATNESIDTNENINITSSMDEENKTKKRGEPVKVDENHPSYELVYDMIIGIKNAVVESYAKRASREEELELNFATEQIALLPKDFTMVNRYHYTQKGVLDENDNVKSSDQQYQFSFKFTDHAPFVFNNIRYCFGFDTADYLDSLTKEISLVELVSPGKSGAFFYISLDQKFIIKTVTEAEAEFFKTFLQNYYQHIMNNPNTLLVKFYGFYMVQPRGQGKEMYFIVMENAFPADMKIDERYDLKGSTVGRSATDAEKENGNAILKDLDINRVILIGSDMKKKLVEQLDKDTKLLAENNIMDYSCLLGVHLDYVPRPKQEDTLEVEGGKKKHNYHHSVFRKDDGGIKSSEKNELYFLLVIDIFTTWNTKKKLENSFKSLMYEASALSAVDPQLYKDRFCNFLGALIH